MSEVSAFGRVLPDVRRSVWRFHPRGGVGTARDEGEERRAQLLSALRAGHGVGAAFALRLDSGPAPSLRLILDDLASERWAARAFVPSFPPHQWTRERVRPSVSESFAFVARRIQPWPIPLRTAADGPPLVDHLAKTAGTLPRGVTVTLEARPLPAPLPGWWEPDSVPWERAPVNRGVPPRGSREAERGHRPAPAPPERPLFWSLGTSIGLSDPQGLDKDRFRSASRAVERATRSGLGNGLSIVGRVRGRFRGSLGFATSEEEMLLVFPGPDCPAPGEAWTNASVPWFALGRTSSGEAVGPEIEPDQGRHLAVLGETGMGKSSMLVALARRASRGYGLILLDPLGETAAALGRELDSEALRSAIRIDPVDHPLRVNALDGIGPPGPDPIRSERRLNDLVHALRRVRAGRYADSSFWGPRLEEMLTRAVRAAASLEQGTLTDAHTLLATGARLHREVPDASRGVLRELGDRIRERPEDAEGARRLVYEVVRSPVLERMLCARSPELASRELVAPGRVVVVSGSASRVGEATARYLLSVYLALVWSELLARPTPSKTFVLLDEAQWFSHESLAEMLRLGRRSNVHVVLATQAISTLPDSVADAVWTNVSDFVAFRGSPSEAHELCRASRALSTEAILSLPRGHAAVLLGKGHTVRWLRTVRVPRPPAEGGPPDAVGPALAREGGGSPGGEGAETPAMGSREGEGPPSDPAAEGARRASAADVLRELKSRACAPTAPERLRVSLEELRRDFDPTGRAVREAGAVLGRSGAIVETERSADGTFWVLASDRVALPGASEDPPSP